MYHKLLIIVVLVFCGCSSSKYGVIPSNKYIIPYSEMPFGNAKEFFGSDWELYVIDFFTPTLDETIIADSIIYMAIDSIASDWNKCNSWIHNRDKITSKNLSKYIRQYSGHINNNGEKEIHVSFIALEFANQYSLKELNSPISVSDGGTEHWCITINLKTRQASDFYVNGFAYLFNEIFGNKIVAVNDASEDEAFGLAPRFASGAYADAVGYDANGNITRDDTRAISSVSYHPFLNLPKKVSFTDGSYLMWDYRPDGKKVKSTSAEKYIRVTVNADGDTIVRQHSQFNTDTRNYLGAFEISGSTWRVFHQAGHTDIASSGTVTNRFYLRDYLGSTAAVIDENGDVLQSTAYFPSGLPLTPNNLAPQTIRLHTGKDYFGLQDAGWYDNRARYYDCIIGRFTTQDPLAEKYPWLSPYNHCANNPLKFVDPDGQRISVIEKGIDYIYTYTDDGYGFYDAHGNPYQGNSEFISKLTNALNSISYNNGHLLIQDLCNSELNITYAPLTNGNPYTEQISDTHILISLNQELNSSEFISSVAHESIHGAQFVFGQGGRYIQNEIEAFVFQYYTSYISLSNGEPSRYLFSDGPNATNNELYDNAINNLTYSNYSISDFNIAVNGFKSYSTKNKYGIYNSYNLFNPNAKISLIERYLKYE